METVPLQLQNFFLNGTEGSYSKFETLSSYHFQALKASTDPFIKERATFYDPFGQKFQEQYILWGSSGETKQGDTKAVSELLDKLSADLIEDWDIRIQTIYKKKTSKYKSLLPNGRKPFQNGKQKDKIDAVDKLIENMGNVAALAQVKDEVTEFFRMLTVAQNTKVGKVSDVKTLSDAVEAARVEACQAMFKNYGDLISHFYLKPQLAAPYFDWDTLHRKQQQTFELTIKADSQKNVAKRTLAANQTITAENQGDTIMTIFSSNKKSGTTGTATITLEVGDIKTFTPAEIGNTKKTPFINVVNTDDKTEAKVKIQIH